MRSRSIVPVIMVLSLAATLATSAQEPPADEVEATKTAWATAIDRVAGEGDAYEELRRCAVCHGYAAHNS